MMREDIRTINLDILKLMREEVRRDQASAIAFFNLSADDADFLAKSSLEEIRQLADKLVPGFCLKLSKSTLAKASSPLVALLASKGGAE